MCYVSRNPQHPLNISLYHNGVYFTLEECQLICALRRLSGDDDLVSEVVKHERKSSQPVNCDGLGIRLEEANLSNIRDLVILPILANVAAAEVKAQNAYKRWMEFMTGVVWESASLAYLPCKSQPLILCIRYQKRGWHQELLNMAPHPFHWMSLLPRKPPSTRLLFGELSDTQYSWDEPGWDIGPGTNMGVASTRPLFGEISDTQYSWNEPGWDI